MMLSTERITSTEQRFMDLIDKRMMADTLGLIPSPSRDLAVDFILKTFQLVNSGVIFTNSEEI
jgi:hypothetical protein